MADPTTTLGFPYPTLTGDRPDGPAQIQALAQAVDDYLTAQGVPTMPIGDMSNSVTLTAGTGPNAPDMRLTGSAQTVIVSATFTLTRQQYVKLEGKALITNVAGSGGNQGSVGIHLAIDGSVNANSHAGPTNVDIAENARVQITTGQISVLLAAGSHTVEFRANRDSTGQLDAKASGSLSTGPTYHPTVLEITV